MTTLDDIANMLGGSSTASVSLTRKRTDSGKFGRLERPPAGTGLSSLGDLAAELETELAKKAEAPRCTLAQAQKLVALLTHTNEAANIEAARSLANFAMEDANSGVICQAGAVPVLVRLLTEGKTGDLRLQSMWALANLALVEVCRKAIHAAGALPSIVSAASVGGEQLKIRAISCLGNFGTSDAYCAVIAAAGGVAPLVAGMKTSNAIMVERSLWALANLATDENVDAAVAATPDACATLYGQFQSTAHPVVREQALRALANVCQNAQNRQTVIALGAVPQFVTALNDPKPAIKQEAARALCNLAQEESVAASVVPALLSALPTSSPDVKELVSRALSNVASTASGSGRIRSSQGGIGQCVQLLQSNNSKSQRLHGVRIVANMAALDDANKIAVRDAGGIPLIVTLLKDPDAEYHLQALFAINNLAISNDNKMSIATPDCVQALVMHCQSPLLEVAAKATECLSTLTAVNAPPLHAIVRDNGAIPVLTKNLSSHSSAEVKLHAIGALSNLAFDDSNQEIIGQAGAIQGLVAGLSHGDERIRERASMGLLNFAASESNRKRIHDAGGAQALASLLNSTAQPRIQLLIARTARNIALLDGNRDAFGAAGGIGGLAKMLSSSDPEHLEEACYALYNMSFSATNKQQMKAHASAITALAGHSAPGVATAAGKLKTLL